MAEMGLVHDLPDAQALIARMKRVAQTLLRPPVRHHHSELRCFDAVG